MLAILIVFAVTTFAILPYLADGIIEFKRG